MDQSDGETVQETGREAISRSALRATPRMLSLDVLRGFAISLMFLVGGNPFSQLQHSGWTGATLADLVYPLFLFSVGVSMRLSTQKKDLKGQPKSEQAHAFLFRAARLLIVGLLLYSASYRVLKLTLGTLQCIALASLGAYPLVRATNVSRVGGIVVILTLFVLLSLFAQPDVVTTQAWLEHTTFSEKLDILVLGKPRGVEGVLSTCVATSIVLFGLIAADLLLDTSASVGAGWKILSCAVACLAAATLCVGIGIPLSTPLFTPSFVFLSSSFAFAVLFALLPLDRRPRAALLFRPLVILGANPIAGYVFVKLFQTFVLNHTSLPVEGEPLIGDWLRRSVGPLSVPLLKLAVGWLFCFALWRRQIFVRL
ncbi:MAG: heparan-alpha-glucosaminide N-acetyltransferase domain-containing protein [Bdellovibrionota bacterium]